MRPRDRVTKKRKKDGAKVTGANPLHSRDILSRKTEKD